MQPLRSRKKPLHNSKSAFPLRHCRNDGRQVLHARDHRFGARIRQPVGVARIGVGRAGEADDAHAGGSCAMDAVHGILDHDHAVGGNAELRRAMQEAGFTVNKIPGPPGKREMVRAEKRS